MKVQSARVDAREAQGPTVELPAMLDTEYRWVLLSEHCRRTGETSQMVHTRRKRGIWLDGKHTKLASKKRLYVNIEEYNKWVESQKH